jgi:hypothetical protein
MMMMIVMMMMTSANAEEEPWLRRLVAGFKLRRPRFDSRSGNVGFVVYKAALGQFFSEYFGFLCQFSFHQLLHFHHVIDAIYFDTDSVVK